MSMGFKKDQTFVWILHEILGTRKQKILRDYWTMRCFFFIYLFFFLYFFLFIYLFLCWRMFIVHNIIMIIWWFVVCCQYLVGDWKAQWIAHWWRDGIHSLLLLLFLFFLLLLLLLLLLLRNNSTCLHDWSYCWPPQRPVIAPETQLGSNREERTCAR